jgi:hypothetical protein
MTFGKYSDQGNRPYKARQVPAPEEHASERHLDDLEERNVKGNIFYDAPGASTG